MTSPLPAAPPDPKSAAACTYMDNLTKLTTDFKAAVSCPAGTGPPGPPALPAATALTQADIEKWLKPKETANAFLAGATVAVDSVAGSFTITHTTNPAKVFNGSLSMVLDDEANNIAAALDPASTSSTPTKMVGGRRGKRSARRSKSRKGGRKSRKGGRKSRGCKGRRSRGRTIKGGAKMSKELKAWMKRQEKATGVKPISKKTIDAAKTTSQATGSEQRSESGKHVAAKQRNL